MKQQRTQYAWHQLIIIIFAGLVAIGFTLTWVPIEFLRYLSIVVLTTQIFFEIKTKQTLFFTSPLFILSSLSLFFFSFLQGMTVYLYETLYALYNNDDLKLYLGAVGSHAERFIAVFALIIFSAHAFVVFYTKTSPASKQLIEIKTHSSISTVFIVVIIILSLTNISYYYYGHDKTGVIYNNLRHISPVLQAFMLVFLVRQSTIKGRKFKVLLVLTIFASILGMLAAYEGKIPIFIALALLAYWLRLNKISVKKIVISAIIFFVFGISMLYTVLLIRSPEIRLTRGSGQLIYGNQIRSIEVFGIKRDLLIEMKIRVAKGRVFNSSEVGSAAKVILLGQAIVENIFQGINPLGKIIRVKGISYTVIGTLPKWEKARWPNNGEIQGGADPGDFVFVPLSAAPTDLAPVPPVNSAPNLFKVLILKLIWRQTDTIYCLKNVLEVHGNEPFTLSKQFFWIKAVVPRILWPEKPSLSLGSSYSSKYCGMYKESPAQGGYSKGHSSSITLLGQPIIQGGLASLILHAGILAIALAVITLITRNPRSLSTASVTAILPWLIDFDQDFAMYVANAMKFFLAILPLIFYAVLSENHEKISSYIKTYSSQILKRR